MKYAMSDFSLAIETLLRSGKEIKSVTVFCNPLSNVRQRVRVSWRNKQDRRASSSELVVSYGVPNYKEMEFLADCKKAKCNPHKYLLWSYPRKRK